MAIEFQCPHCRSLLRVEDDARGKKVECPQCGQVSQLPTAIESPPPVAAAAPSPLPVAEVGVPLAKGPLLATRIDLGAVISRAWTILGQQYSISLAASVLFLAISIGVSAAADTLAELGKVMGDPVSVAFLSGVVRWVFNTWLAGGMTLFFLKVSRGQRAEISELFAAGRYLWHLLVANFLVLLLFVVILAIGSFVPAIIGYLAADEMPPQQHAERPAQVNAKRAAAKADSKQKQEVENPQEKPPIADHPADDAKGSAESPVKEQASPPAKHEEVERQWAVQEEPIGPRGEVALTAAFIGFLFCLAPLVYFGLMFSQAVPLMVDRQMGAVEALRQSMRITRGNKLSLLVLGLLGAVLSFGGVLTCCVGLIFVLPFIWTLGITAYLAMTSQLPES